MDSLSPDILKEIFKNLDYSTLTKAKTVCKTWKIVIDNTKFAFNINTQLNDDVLEVIFSHLNFRSLDAAERVCKRWKELINDRRLYWQLTKRICRATKRKLPKSTSFNKSNFHKGRRKLCPAPTKNLSKPNKLSKHHFSRRKAT